MQLHNSHTRCEVLHGPFGPFASRCISSNARRTKYSRQDMSSPTNMSLCTITISMKVETPRGIMLNRKRSRLRIHYENIVIGIILFVSIEGAMHARRHVFKYLDRFFLTFFMKTAKKLKFTVSYQIVSKVCFMRLI